MKRQFVVLLLGSMLLVGCAPHYRRAAMCPPNPCGPCNSYYMSSQPCGTSEVIISSDSGSSVITSPGGIDSRVHSIENNLDSLRNDVGNLQRHNNQLDRKIDKIDRATEGLGPLK